MSSSDNSSVGRKLLLIATCLLGIVLISSVSFAVVRSAVGSNEETFTDAAIAHGEPLGIYVDVLAIDPVRNAMNLRLDVATGSGSRGTQYYAPLHRELELGVSDGQTHQGFAFHRDALANSRDFVASLEGVVGFYPFDRYSTRIATSARDVRSDGPHALPLRLTVWGGVSGWAVRAMKERSAPAGTDVLTFSIRRPAPLVFFACVLYGIMVLIAASALTIGTLIFVGIRRVEPTLISALVAMAFALPALRNILPGGPPLGVIADIVIVLWAEVAVGIGLILTVLAWARRGSK